MSIEGKLKPEEIKEIEIRTPEDVKQGLEIWLGRFPGSSTELAKAMTMLNDPNSYFPAIDHDTKTFQIKAKTSEFPTVFETKKVAEIRLLISYLNSKKSEFSKSIPLVEKLN